MNKVIGIIAGVGAIIAVIFTAFLWTCCRVYVPAGQMAIVTAKTGDPLPPGRILAEPGEIFGLPIKSSAKPPAAQSPKPAISQPPKPPPPPKTSPVQQKGGAK